LPTSLFLFNTPGTTPGDCPFMGLSPSSLTV